MKNILLIILAGFLLIPFKNIQAQTYITQTEVLSSGGGISAVGTYSNFGVVGETFVSDATVGNNLTNYSGFIHSCLEVRLKIDVRAFLQGPFVGTEMNADINEILPLAQPYSDVPWNYIGSESVASIPNSNIIDWILVELRDASDAASADGSTTVTRQAAFLLKDGKVVGLDGSSNLIFDETINQDLFVVIWHRNHLGVLSANPLTLTDGVYTYDFKTSATQAYNSGQKNLGGFYGLYAGDANADDHININDNLVWKTEAGTNGYKSTDFNMDSEIDNIDKNDKWIENNNTNSQVPN